MPRAAAADEHPCASAQRRQSRLSPGGETAPPAAAAKPEAALVVSTIKNSLTIPPWGKSNSFAQAPLGWATKCVTLWPRYRC